MNAETDGKIAEVLPAVRLPGAEGPSSPISESRAVLATIERLALDPTVSVEKMDHILQMQERILDRRARMAFAEAIADAKAEMPAILKNKHVGFESKKEGAAKTDYWHEDFAEIAKTIDPILGKFGLSYRFRTVGKPGEPVTVTCIVAHREGHQEETTLTAPHDASGNKNPLQAIGSSVTYLQRYTLKAALGLAASRDDDAQSISNAMDMASPEQIDALKAIAAKAERELSAVLEWAKVDDIAKLTAAKCDEAIAQLTRRAERIAKGAKNG
jgi:hypothetical protein